MGYYIVNPDVEQCDMEFCGTAGAPPPTPAENDLVKEIERTLRALRTIYEGRVEERAAQFGILLNLARAGLTGPQAQPAFAERMLAEFKAAILERESGPMKNRYMAVLGRACAKAGVPLLLGGVALRLVARAGMVPGADMLLTRMAGNFALLLASCAAGVWVSFGARKGRYTFEDLVQPEADHLYPSSRLAFAGIMTMALALVFHSGAAQVSIGALTTADVLKSAVAAMVVGFLCGFSEQVLAKALTAQASRILGV